MSERWTFWNAVCWLVWPTMRLLEKWRRVTGGQYGDWPKWGSPREMWP